MKRVLAFLCAVVLICSLAACGETKNEESSQKNNESSQSQSDSPADLIIGTWKEGQSGGYPIITFNSDGTGEICAMDNDTSAFSWSIDSSNELTVTSKNSDGGSGKYQYYPEEEFRALTGPERETSWLVVEKALYLGEMYFIR